MEDNVYLCSWTQSSGGFLLWLKSRPDIRAAGVDYQDAERQLLEAIQLADDVMVAVLEFDPPLPVSASEQKYGHPKLFLITGDDRFVTDAPRGKPFEEPTERETRLRWLDEFYKNPVCRKCGNASSPRSDKPITLTHAPSRYDGGFGTIGVADGGSTHQIVSEEFLDLLTAIEKQSLQFRPTIHKGRKKFYELTGPEGPPFVAVADLQANGWQCTQCQQRTWGYWIEGLSMNSFIRKSDLADPIPNVFTVGTWSDIQLVVTATRWQEMVGKKGTLGFVSSPLGVVPDAEVLKALELPLR